MKKVNVILHILGVGFIASICVYGIFNGFPGFYLWKLLLPVLVLGSIVIFVLYLRQSVFLSAPAYLILFGVMAAAFGTGSVARRQTIEQEKDRITTDVWQLSKEVADLSSSPRLNAIKVDYECLNLLAIFSLVGVVYTTTLLLLKSRNRIAPAAPLPDKQPEIVTPLPVILPTEQRDIATPPAVDSLIEQKSKALPSPKKKWSRKTKLLLGGGALAVCIIAVIIFVRLNKYQYVHEYESNVLDSITDLTNALEKVERNGNAVLLLPSAEHANKTMFQLAFAPYYEMETMPEGDFLKWRLRFKTRFENKREEARALLAKIRSREDDDSLSRDALSQDDGLRALEQIRPWAADEIRKQLQSERNALKSKALSYIDDQILSYSVDTAPLPTSGRRIDHVFAKIPISAGPSPEKFIAKADNTWLKDTLVLSPDGRHVACAVDKGGEMFVSLDGKDGKAYSGIVKNSLIFSPDSGSLAYAAIAKGSGSAYVVLNGTELGPYEGINVMDGGGLAFSPDSTRLAFVAKAGTKQFVVIGGEETKRYDNMGSMDRKALVFSPNSRRLAYVAKLGGKQFVTVDGKEERAYDGITLPTFSPDSKRLAYGIVRGHRNSIVVDGKEQEQYDGMSAFVFSPDSARLINTARFGTKWAVVIDGKPGKSYDSVWDRPPAVSPDSKHISFVAKVGSQSVVVLDDKEGERYDGVANRVIFSPDSNHLAYVAQRGQKWLVVSDEKKGPLYDGVSNDTPIFSPNSARVAYAANEGTNYFVVVDGKENRQYQFVGSPVFSPDSKRFAYVAKTSSNQFVVIDGKDQAKYDVIVPGTLSFGSDGGIRYLAGRGDNLYLVETGKDLQSGN